MLAASLSHLALNGRVDATSSADSRRVCRALGLIGLRPSASGRSGRRPVRVHRADPGRPRPVRRVDRAGRRGRCLRRACWKRFRAPRPPPALLQRQVQLAPGALGFLYDTGLYLQFRATGPDDFHLAYAAALADGGPRNSPRPTQLVSDVTERRPSWREARWVAVVINYRAERWSDVVKLLTPIVNDPELDERFAHAAKIALGTALARLGMFAPALSYLEEPDGPVAVAAVDGALAKALVAARPRRRGRRPARCCRTCTPPTRRTNRSKRRCRIPVSGS